MPAAPAGYQQLLQLASQQPGQRVWASEGSGGYGAGLTRFLAAHAEQVVALDRPKPTARRHGAKSDSLDAIRAAREALGRDQLAQPRAAGHRAALSVRLAARRSAVPAATDGQRQLHALVVAAPDTLRRRLRDLTTPRLVSTGGRRRLQSAWDAETIAAAASLRALARRLQLLDAEVAEPTRAITVLVRAWHPDLLARPGVARSWPPPCCVPGPSRPLPLGCWLRPAGRAAPSRLLWSTGSGAAESLWRPSTQPGPARGRPDPAAL